MKKKWIIACALLATAACGCQENDKFYYDASASALNIWLGRETVVVDSIVYNFAYQKDFDSVVFHVRLTGLPADVDRAFTLEATEGDADRLHYTLGNYVLKAGAYQASFPIYLEKPGGYDEFKEESGHVLFKMKENAYFREGASETSSLYIVLKNNVGKPDNWDAATSPYRTLLSVFGAYSDVKYAFIIQTTGLSNFKVYYTTDPNKQLAEDEITLLQAQYLASSCKLALAEHEALHGPLLDENGARVVFP
jgi:hypothetical protein